MDTSASAGPDKVNATAAAAAVFRNDFLARFFIGLLRDLLIE
jgi:hypothetical protein